MNPFAVAGFASKLFLPCFLAANIQPELLRVLDFKVLLLTSNAEMLIVSWSSVLLTLLCLCVQSCFQLALVSGEAASSMPQNFDTLGDSITNSPQTSDGCLAPQETWS